MAALDLLGRRWALRILWELRAGPLPFRALRGAAGDVSPAVLNTRLAELREAGLIESTPLGYATTAVGRDLCAALEPLQAWARRWASAGSFAGRAPRRSAPSTGR
jgi:DNA-binding HxlR family transcriptional regulator